MRSLSGTTALAFSAAVIAAAAVLPAAADSEAVEAVSPRILFAVSGGYWETIPEAVEEENGEEAAAASAGNGGPPARGYYRAVAYRAEDNTFRLYLQQVALAEGGPEIVETTEIEAVTEARAYITDMRPENSTGVASAPGFAAFVFLKQDPQAAQPETWELFVDEFGDVTIDGATN